MRGFGFELVCGSVLQYSQCGTQSLILILMSHFSAPLSEELHFSFLWGAPWTFLPGPEEGERGKADAQEEPCPSQKHQSSLVSTIHVQRRHAKASDTQRMHMLFFT